MMTLLGSARRLLGGRGLLLVLLGAILLAEAWGVVVVRQQVREASTHYAQLLQQQREQQARWTQLVLEYSHLISPLRVERAARQQLRMVHQSPVQTIILHENR